MNFRVALPDTVIFQIMLLDLSAHDRIRLASMLLDRLEDFPAVEGERVVQSYAMCLGSSDVYATVCAMLLGEVLVVLRAHFDPLV